MDHFEWNFRQNIAWHILVEKSTPDWKATRDLAFLDWLLLCPLLKPSVSLSIKTRNRRLSFQNSTQSMKDVSRLPLQILFPFRTTIHNSVPDDFPVHGDNKFSFRDHVLRVTYPLVSPAIRACKTNSSFASLYGQLNGWLPSEAVTGLMPPCTVLSISVKTEKHVMDTLLFIFILVPVTAVQSKQWSSRGSTIPMILGQLGLGPK